MDQSIENFSLTFFSLEQQFLDDCAKLRRRIIEEMSSDKHKINEHLKKHLKETDEEISSLVTTILANQGNRLTILVVLPESNLPQ